MKLLALSINGTPIPAPSGIPTEGLSGSGGKIIGFGLALFLIVCVLLSLGFIVWGGLTWVWSEGDKAKVESSRRTIIYAIVGLLICFLSFFAVNLLLKSFDPNLDLFHLSL
jgi:ABC-type Fe3+ transport system permease subunit